MQKLIGFVLVILFHNASFAQSSNLQQQIEQLVADKQLKLGFAAYNISTTDSIGINADSRFPMQSVFKFPIALAMLQEVDKGSLTLHHPIRISEADRRPGLWSPIEKRFPEGDIFMPLSELITYTVALSDNTGCDVLLKLLGGASSVNNYVRGLGVTDINIVNNEKELQSNWAVQFDNWTTPKAMIQLLRLFYGGTLLSDASNAFLLDVMASTSTGSVRMNLPKDAWVAYKTGTSGYNANKVSAATNCVGLLKQANGNVVAFAIFITNSTEAAALNAAVIADIAALLYVQ